MSGSASRKKWLKPLKIVLWSIFGLIVLLILIVEGTQLVQKYIMKNPVPMFAGYGSFVVATGSMTGTINQGDMIVIKQTDDYELGDIVTYLREGETVPTTHRIVNYGPEEGTFITKGDFNDSIDVPAVKEGDIVGEVVLIIPKLGIVVDWFLTGGGIVYLVAMVVIVGVGVYLLRKKPAPAKKTDDDTAPPPEDDGQPKE